MTDLAVRTKGKRRLQHGGEWKIQGKGKGHQENVYLQVGEAPETEGPPGGARAVLAEGAEKGGMNGTLERPKDVPCFSLGAWKVSREWRARDKPILHYWKINSFLVYQTQSKTYLLNTAFAAVGPSVQLPLSLIGWVKRAFTLPLLGPGYCSCSAVALYWDICSFVCSPNH